MKHKLMIIALIALMALVMMPVQATAIICTPPGGTYAKPMYITCAMDTASWGLDTGNQSMRFYFMEGGKAGIVRADISNEVSYLPHEGGYVARVFWPPAYNYSNSNTVVMTYGTATYPNTCSQALNTTLNETAGCRFAGYYQNNSYTFTAWEPPALMANFTATPSSGAAPLYVMFDDTTVNITGTATYNWSITPASGVSAGATGTMENHAASFSVPGNYTVSHGVTCPAGSDIETKTDYITVYNATTDYITTAFAAMDSPRWVQLAGANIHLLDVENGTWTNATPSLTGYLEITTLSNHTIDAYADMLGYGDADLLAQPAWGGGTYTILMYPDGYANVSAGNVTLYVTVYASDADRLAGAEIEVTWEPWAENIKQSVTDSSGMAQFTVPNQSTIYIAAEKQGYTGLATSVDSGTGSGGDAAVYTELTLQRNFLTPTATQTTLPGGGTPTPEVTVLPGCEDPDSPECTAARQQFMADDVTEQLMEFMPLFWLAILIGLVKLIFKGW